MLKWVCCTCRYDDVNVAVESNLRKQAEVMHGIDANMQAFGDILQQNASSQQVRDKTSLPGLPLSLCTHLIWFQAIYQVSADLGTLRILFLNQAFRNMYMTTCDFLSPACQCWTYTLP